MSFVGWLALLFWPVVILLLFLGGCACPSEDRSFLDTHKRWVPEASAFNGLIEALELPPLDCE